MKRKQIRFIIDCLLIGLMVSVTIIMSACSSKQISAPAQPPTLSSITVKPTSPNLAVNSTQQFTATGNYSNGSTMDITSEVTWTSLDITVATISPGGLATGITPGESSISASLSGINSSPAIDLLVEP